MNFENVLDLLDKLYIIYIQQKQKLLTPRSTNPKDYENFQSKEDQRGSRISYDNDHTRYSHNFFVLLAQELYVHASLPQRCVPWDGTLSQENPIPVIKKLSCHLGSSSIYLLYTTI